MSHICSSPVCLHSEHDFAYNYARDKADNIGKQRTAHGMARIFDPDCAEIHRNCIKSSLGGPHHDRHNARKTLIDANRPMSGGKMETTVFSPSFAPVTNDEKTSVPRKKFKFGILRSIE